MNKLGRNDPCPSGTGVKFKKCLAAHPCLGLQSSTAEIWWTCDRWQAPPPDLKELRNAMSSMQGPSQAKMDAFLDLVFAAPPSEVDFWQLLLAACALQGHTDIPGLFQRLSAHLSAAEYPDLYRIYHSITGFLMEDHPEMFPHVLAATLALDPATTPMESLEMIVSWAVSLDRPEDLDRLRSHFPEFPEYMIDGPEDESAPADTEEEMDRPHRAESSPKFPPEIEAALDKAWENFNALDSPTVDQVAAFLDGLLALPHEATPWHETFNAVTEHKQIDLFRIFHRLADALAPARHKDFAFICWSAVEQVLRDKAPERLPEITRALIKFDPEGCDPDALSHIGDALLGYGFVNEMIGLMVGFLPKLRDNEDVLEWVLPHVAWEIFLLRLGTLIASGEYRDQPADLLLDELCAGLDDDICKESASVPIRYLLGQGGSFSKEHFRLPSSTSKPAEQQGRVETFHQIFVEVARDEWLVTNRHPAQTLVGLHMILRAAEHWITSPREKGRKYPLNLLDCLNSSAMDRLVPIECSDMLGIKRERADVMLHACLALIRWAGKQELITEKESAKAEAGVVEMMKHLWP